MGRRILLRTFFRITCAACNNAFMGVLKQPGAKVVFQKTPVASLEAVTRGVLWKKVFLEISQNLQENICARDSFLIKLQARGLQLYLKKSLAQLFSCEFCKISKNTFFTEHLRTTASASLDYVSRNSLFYYFCQKPIKSIIGSHLEKFNITYIRT